MKPRTRAPPHPEDDADRHEAYLSVTHLTLLIHRTNFRRLASPARQSHAVGRLSAMLNVHHHLHLAAAILPW